MSDAHAAPLSAAEVKAQARTLGAHLVGIADGQAMERNPPHPNAPRRPSDITERDGHRVVVIGLHINCATARAPAWDHQHKFYNDELTLTALEEIALSLVFWLEERGWASIVVPANMVDTEKPGVDPTRHQPSVLSLDHAAVEAGLGTLGLNHQLLTPEYGPRVRLISVLTSAQVAPDRPMDQALCRGAECGRCLRACPADAVGHWQRNWDACDRYRMPYGFVPTMEFMERLVAEPDPQKKAGMLRSEESYKLWTGIMRGAGVITGCRRCQDVCPVGADYATMIGDALEVIAEDTPEKRNRLEAMMRSEASGDSSARLAHARWIGTPP